MFYYDIHTHIIPDDRINVISIINSGEEKKYAGTSASDLFFSVGIHPADIIGNSGEMVIFKLRSQLNASHTVAIGEAGIDHLVTTVSIEKQIEIFEQLIALSEEVQKPLIIHNVRATGEIMHLFKKYRPTQPWIIHGFRGNPQTASQLQQAGIWLSLGERYNETLFSEKKLDLNRVVLETDGHTDIKTVYRQIAKSAQMGDEAFRELIGKNVRTLFPSLP